MKSMGENTRRTKTFIKYLRNEAMRVKNEAREKYEKKLRFLKTKYGGESMDDRMEKPPKGLEIYGEAKIFSRHEYDDLRRQDQAVVIVGDMEISENEKQALRLPPKYGLMARLMETDFENDIELGLAKL